LFTEIYLKIDDDINKHFFLQISEDSLVLDALEYKEVYP